MMIYVIYKCNRMIGNLQFSLSNMQSHIDLIIAYANKVALELSIKEHAINRTMIQQEGRTIYSLNALHSPVSFRRYTGLNGEYNSREEGSLCNHALEMIESGMTLNGLLSKRGKILIESAFARKLTLVKKESKKVIEQEEIPFQSFRGMDYELKSTKQKVRKFIIANYQKTPHEIGKLMRSLSLPAKLIKQWIQYSEKFDRIIMLREEVLKLSLHQTVTFADLKRMARKIYKTRLFHATDNWCVNYIRKYRLEDVIEIPEQLKRK